MFDDRSSMPSNRRSRLQSVIKRQSVAPYGRTLLCTGSQYVGCWDVLSMHGRCQYVFPDGIQYIGSMNHGHFHGAGKLILPNEGIIHGYWVNGKNIKMNFQFADGLEFKETDWEYCRPKANRTFAPDETRSIPGIGAHLSMPRIMSIKDSVACYHTREGIYNPSTKCIYSKDDRNVILRIPTKREEKWIMKNCPKSEIEHVGYCKDLLEQTPYVLNGC